MGWVNVIRAALEMLSDAGWSGMRACLLWGVMSLNYFV